MKRRTFVYLTFFFILSCKNGSQTNSCFQMNQCDKAALNCIADYYIFTQQTDFPINVCLYYQEACKKYCRECERTGTARYKSCYSEKWNLLGGAKPNKIDLSKANK